MTVADHVCRVTIGDAAALDRRSVTEAVQFRDALLHAADDDNVKAIILAGLAGGSAASVASPADAEAPARQLYSGTRGLHQIVTYCKKVVIAEVDGPCGATASSFCLASDFVIATPDSTFASPFTVAEASYPLAVLTMRANRTKAWMFRGTSLSAEDALEAGFVNSVVAASGVRDATAALGRRVASMPLDGITVSKMNVGAAFDVIGVGADYDAVEASVAAGGIQW
jgi:enoyl-CoA hydratase/carnithine racemase